MDSRRIEEALRAAIDDSAESPEVRGRALESIGALSASWVRGSIENAYRSGDWRLRVSAVHAMGRNCDPHWLPAANGRSSAATTRRCASRRPPPARPAATSRPSPFSSRCSRTTDAEVQEAAIAALGEIGGDEAKRALEEIGDHPEPRVREAVAAALEETGVQRGPSRVPSALGEATLAARKATGCERNRRPPPAALSTGSRERGHGGRDRRSHERRHLGPAEGNA